MIDYNIKEGKLVIDPSTLTVAAFNNIWNADQTRSKNKASNTLTYVFTLCDERDRNPFKDVAYDKKEAACKKNAFGKADHSFTQEEQELIDEAIAWFEYLNANSIQRLSKSIDQQIDKMVKFLSEHKIENMAAYKSSSDEIVKVANIIKSKLATDKLMREEMQKVKTKGNVSRSLLAKRVI
jgi:hypothetical protein